MSERLNVAGRAAGESCSAAAEGNCRKFRGPAGRAPDIGITSESTRGVLRGADADRVAGTTALVDGGVA